MPYHRPRNTQKDLNHSIVKDVCQIFGWQYGGLPLYLVDTSDQGGEMLDWLLWMGRLCLAIEVKTEEAYRLKNHRLKQGEMDFIDKCPGVSAIVTTEQQVTELLLRWYPVAKLISGGN